jgi:hypothetical protein
MASASRKYWVAVASRDHVQRGCDGGFAQACHGKSVGLKRTRVGDQILYYSPKFAIQDKASTCRRFTALGTITNNIPYQAGMNPDFKPFRIDVAFRSPVKEVDWDSVKSKLTFQSKLRFGFLEVDEDEFKAIADRMID